MIKILFLIRDLEQGGAERQLLELLKKINKNRFSISIISFYNSGSLWEEARGINGLNINFINKNGRWDMLSLWSIFKIISKIRPDIIHGYMGVLNILSVVGKIFGAKVVWAVRSSNMDWKMYGRLCCLVFRLECMLSHWTDLIICNSYAGRAFVVSRGYPSQRTIVIRNGIDVERFKPDGEARSRIRSSWKIADRDFLIGVPARLDPMKGLDVFLHAAAVVSLRYAFAKFVSIGGGSDAYSRILRSQSEALGLSDRIIWAGPRLDMPAVLNALDLVVSASVFGEGFSNVLAESIACGVPCVATDVGDARSILGDEKWLVRPNNSDELADKISSAINCLPREKAGFGAAVNRIAANYSTATLAEESERHFTRLVAEGSVGHWERCDKSGDY